MSSKMAADYPEWEVSVALDGIVAGFATVTA